MLGIIHLLLCGSGVQMRIGKLEFGRIVDFYGIAGWRPRFSKTGCGCYIFEAFTFYITWLSKRCMPENILDSEIQADLIFVPKEKQKMATKKKAAKKAPAKKAAKKTTKKKAKK